MQSLSTMGRRPRSKFAAFSHVCVADAVEKLESRVFFTTTTWYVAPTGSNTNAGTLSAPFHTIQFAADKAHAGDTVDIRAGTYRETVVVHNSGTTAAPIIFQPYNNESVTIDGADVLTGWTPSTGNVWTATMNENLGVGNNQIFVDGQMMNDARWPNTSLDVSNPVYAHVATVTATPVYAPVTPPPSTGKTSGTTKTTTTIPPVTPPPPVILSTTYTITNTSMNQPANFWIGGVIRIAGIQDWVTQTSTITASGPGWVTFSLPGSPSAFQAPTKSSHYYLFGVAGAVEAAGEFFRAGSGLVSLWTPQGDSPANHVVEAKARQYGFDLSAVSNVQIDGLNFFACSIKTRTSSSNIVLNGIAVEYVSQFGLTPDGWTPPLSGIILAGAGDVLENSTVAFSAGNGVCVLGKSDRIVNNVIHDCDYAAVDAAPIQVYGANVLIDGNTIYNAGRDGIFFLGTAGTITFNLVHDFGLQNTDLGGFYAYGLDGGGTVIAYNEFYNGITGGFGGSGIMFDNNSSDFIVHHNITWNVNSGLRINQTGLNILVYNNTLDGTKWSLDIDSSRYDWTGTALENNIFPKPVNFGQHSIHTNNVTNNGKFVNAAAGNYQLVAGAPAIDAGVRVPPYTNGYLGDAPDDGALAYKIAPFAVGAVPLLPPVTPPKVRKK